MIYLPELEVDIPGLRDMVGDTTDWPQLSRSRFRGINVDMSHPCVKAIVDQLTIKPKSGIFIKLPPKTDSGIHKDAPIRLVGLNVILSERLDGSMVAFHTSHRESAPVETWLSTERIPVLLNTQAFHRAVNFVDEARVVISLTYVGHSLKELGDLHSIGKLIQSC